MCMAAALRRGWAAGVLHIIDSMSMVALHVHEVAADNAVNQMKELLAEEKHIQFDKLQRAAAKLEMSGKEGEAVEMLHKAWEKADKERYQHEAYELQMLLVEMLIYKGEYVKALYCKCLGDKDMLDARGPLYKAVIYSMRNEPEEAKEHYGEFQKNKMYIIDLPYSFREGSLAYDAVRDFAESSEIVNDMEKEIEPAYQAK